MLIWFQHLPEKQLDYSKWYPFIKNGFLRTHYMKFVYLIQILTVLIPILFVVPFTNINLLILISIGILTFITHEIIHILVVFKKGDISLTFSGIFFWLNTNAILSKIRFFTFMSAPFIILSVFPAVLSAFVKGDIRNILVFISWLNTFFSASDIINSFLILLKPKHSLFCNGYYYPQFKNQETN